VNAVAMLTDVSFTLHLSGLGGEVMTFGPPGRVDKSLSLFVVVVVVGLAVVVLLAWF